MRKLDDDMRTMQHAPYPALAPSTARFVASEQVGEVIAALHAHGYRGNDLRAILGGNRLRPAHVIRKPAAAPRC